MAVVSDKNLSQTYIVARAKEVLAKSEAYLLKVLDGKTKLPERVVAQVALELYKRRIPTTSDGNQGSNQLTIIKVVKNHMPDHEGDTVDIELETNRIESAVDNKILELNKKIKAKKDLLYKQTRRRTSDGQILPM